MNAGTDKWWVGVLALVIAVVGGFSVHFMSNSNSAPAPEPSTTTTATTPNPEVPAMPAVAAAPPVSSDYQRVRYDPIHFKPAIDKATDADCLKCHQEVLDTNTRALALYRRMGWAIEGIELVFDPEKFEDVAVESRLLKMRYEG